MRIGVCVGQDHVTRSGSTVRSNNIKDVPYCSTIGVYIDQPAGV
ncbi:hypothetical protein FQN60_003235 [Etheostoma spectabile]|uniref:Uncharacterized protein n=1 Tax=Etheostoma spectabile TaxID=54343 RepID=A0A5J5CIM8_9PERO|nr:hypothetical protein FQN60_003235 [Etheostoma spectabile]